MGDISWLILLKKITLLNVIEVLEGKIKFSGNNNIALDEVFIQAENELCRVLDVSLSEIIMIQQKHENNITYHI